MKIPFFDCILAVVTALTPCTALVVIVLPTEVTDSSEVVVVVPVGTFVWVTVKRHHSIYFPNEKLEELDKVTHAWITFSGENILV